MGSIAWRRWAWLFFFVCAALLAIVYWHQRSATRPDGPSPANHAGNLASQEPTPSIAPAEVPQVSRETEPKQSERRGSGVIRGQVYNPDGTPSVGARVQWTQRESPFAQEPDGPARELAVDGQGYFELTDLPWAAYGLVATNGDRMGYEGVRLDAGRPYAFARIVLSDSAVIAGVVVDENGAPVSGAEISPWQYEREDVQSFARIQLRTQSNDDGAFETLPLPVGGWAFRVRAEGFAQLVSNTIQAGTRDARIVLARGVSVHGVAVDITTAAPKANIAVLIVDASKRLAPEKQTTNASGEFKFPALAPGAYLLAPDDDRYVAVDGALKLDVPQDEGLDDVELRIAEGGLVSGSVIDADSREGIADIEIETFVKNNRVAPPRRTKTDESGNFELTRPPPRRCADHAKRRPGNVYGAFAKRASRGPR